MRSIKNRCCFHSYFNACFKKHFKVKLQRLILFRSSNGPTPCYFYEPPSNCIAIPAEKTMQFGGGDAGWGDAIWRWLLYLVRLFPLPRECRSRPYFHFRRHSHSHNRSRDTRCFAPTAQSPNSHQLGVHILPPSNKKLPSTDRVWNMSGIFWARPSDLRT